MTGNTSGNNGVADGGGSGSVSSSSGRQDTRFETKFETLGSDNSESFGELAPSMPNPYSKAWEDAFGTQESNWDVLAEVPFAGDTSSGGDVIYMAKDEFESYVNEFNENKDIESLKGMRGLLKDGKIVLVSNSDDEVPKPKVLVRTKRRK